MSTESGRIKLEIDKKKAEFREAKNRLSYSYNNPIKKTAEAKKEIAKKEARLSRFRENQNLLRGRDNVFATVLSSELGLNFGQFIDSNIISILERKTAERKANDPRANEGTNHEYMMKRFDQLITQYSDEIAYEKATIASLKPEADLRQKELDDLERDIQNLEAKHKQAKKRERDEYKKEIKVQDDIDRQRFFDQQREKNQATQAAADAKNAHELEVLRLRAELMDKERELEEMRRGNLKESVDDMNVFFDDVLKDR